MKLGPDVLVELVAIFQKGLLRQTDVSDDLRRLDLKVDKATGQDPGTLVFSDEYKESRE